MHFKKRRLNKAIYYEINPRNFSELMFYSVMENAQVIKQALSETKEIFLSDLQKQTHLNDKNFNQAIGWLMRENAICFIENNYNVTICINEKNGQQ